MDLPTEFVIGVARVEHACTEAAKAFYAAIVVTDEAARQRFLDRGEKCLNAAVKIMEKVNESQAVVPV